MTQRNPAESRPQDASGPSTETATARSLEAQPQQQPRRRPPQPQLPHRKSTSSSGCWGQCQLIMPTTHIS